MSQIPKMRAVLVLPGVFGRVVELEAGLPGLQAALGGLVENFARFDLGDASSRVADVWCNDDFTGLPPNRLVRVPGFEGPIYGPILVTAADERAGRTYSLTDEELQVAMRMVARWPLAISMPEVDE